MCGIAGVLWHSHQELARSEQTVRRMTDAIAHRGPDGEGFFAAASTQARFETHTANGDTLTGQATRHDSRASLGLGHRRLSIIDLAGGAQPMSDAHQRSWIVFNGEIYNYRALRSELESLGCTFRTQSDTESILHAYRIWGQSCVEHLHGMFAFALWDELESTLFLARDRLGIKPLLWANAPDGFLFCSELKGILAARLLEPSVRRDSIKRFLHNLYVPAPEGPLEKVSTLEPGHSLLFKQGKIELKRFWKPSFAPGRKRSDREWLEAFDGALREAVSSHMVSDVPVGAFLSGGLDSSAITALMAKSGQARSRILTTTVGFEEREFDESKDAQTVADHVGSDHSVVMVRNSDIEPALERVLQAFDQPFADSSSLATFLLCGGARERMKVAMAGDGADELLAGYPRHQHYLGLDLLRTAAGPARHGLGQGARFLASKLHGRASRVLDQTGAFLASAPRTADPAFPYAYLRNAFRDGLYTRLTTDEFAENTAEADPYQHLHRVVAESQAPHRMQQLLEMELHSYLPNDILQKVDIASMAFGLEVRVPFLDHRLVELVAQMPFHLKWNGRKTKVALRQSVTDLLPARTFKKRKQGFHVPLAAWFRASGARVFRDVALSTRALERGYFRKSILEQLIAEHSSGLKNHGPQLWTLLQLEYWHLNFVDANA